ncbi:MAG: PilZ domain-containing protein [Terriglobales bacterium]
MPASNGHALRRSSRVPINVPVRVTSLEPNGQFSEVCETLVVSAHGCALRFPIRLHAGSALRLHSREGREATAYVVACEPLGSDGQGWRLGAKLDRPENFWGLEACPEDWRILEMPSPSAQPPSRALTAGSVFIHKPQGRSASSQAILDKIEEQLSEDRLRGILAKLVKPLQAEITELREKLSRDARRNRFEVSLGQIPPEVEEKLWERLRKDLGARVLQQTREQSAEALGSAKTTIEQKISEAQAEFRHRLSGELHAVEQRAQALSRELTATTGQQVRTGVEKLQRQALDAEAHLNAQGAELLGSLEQRLVEKHDVHRREIEQIQADVVAKSSHLQSEVMDLGRRIATLNESVRRLESDLDAHLEGIARQIVSDARTQLESAVGLALKDLQTRGSNEVGNRLDEVCSQLRTIQNRIENSFSGSLRSQGEEAVQSFGQEIEELAEQSVEKWRLALAKHLDSVAKTLGREFRGEGEREQDHPPLAG